MFREMRRRKQKLSEEECFAVLQKNTSGVLAVMGDDDYPYAVPLSYVHSGNKIFFHCAKSGHKLDAISQNSKVSFCVIDQDFIVPEEYTTYYRSVIAFGKAKVLTDQSEILPALEILAAKYSPMQVVGRKKVIEQQMSNVSMIEMTIEHLSGKEARELKTLS